MTPTRIAVLSLAALALCACESEPSKPAGPQAQTGATGPYEDDFLNTNAGKPGVETLPSGLQYKIIQAGNGPSPKATDKVKVHYEGTFPDGRVFDSSYQRNAPIAFPLNGVIKGWTEGVQLMKEGAIWMLYIPYPLAYGEAGRAPKIPPKQTLVFKIQLIKVNP